MDRVIGIKSAYSLEDIEVLFQEKPILEKGDEVVFKDEDGNEEYGIVEYVGRERANEGRFKKKASIVRKANEDDINRVDQLIEMAKNALNVCKEMVENFQLGMNVFRAGYSFDKARVYFMFTAEDRVDFRELVKLLAKRLKKQIHLRQLGPRDKAKIIGGYGKCGRELCCSSWLDNMESINMEMVRVQSLESKGSSKLSGSCGKLLCCLKYEVETYKDLKKGMPRIGDNVKVKEGGFFGRVIGVDILNQKVKVLLDGGEAINLAKDMIILKS